MTTIKKPFLSSKTKKIIIGFLLIQGIFAINNYYSLNKIIVSQVKETEEGYKNFNNFNKALKGADQETIIYHFGTLVDKNGVSDLLLSGIAERAKYNGKLEIENKSYEEWAKKFPKEAEEERSKWTEQTKKFIIDNYLRAHKAGLLRDKNMFDKMSCLIVDLSCQKMKQYYKEKINQTLEEIEYKIDSKFYDINHPNEYLVWRENLIKNGMTPDGTEHLSPGAKVMKNK